MKSNYILSFVFVMVGLVSCKKEAGNVQQEPAQDTTTVATQQQPIEAQPTAEPSAQPSATGKASELGHDYTFLTDKMFLFKGSFGGTNKGEQLYKDEWIDFSPDGTYKAGKLKEQTHTGKWAYNNDVKTLLLKPDVTTVNITEWKVMYNEQMMVWIGTQTYGNHSTQVQLVRGNDLP